MYHSISPSLTLCSHFFAFSRQHDFSLLLVCARGPAARCSGLRSVDLGIPAPGHRQDHQALQKEIRRFTNSREQPAGPLQKHLSECLQTAVSGASGPSGEQAGRGELHLSPRAQEEQGRPGDGRGHSDHHARGHCSFKLVGFSGPCTKQETFLLVGQQRTERISALADFPSCIRQRHPRFRRDVHLNLSA